MSERERERERLSLSYIESPEELFTKYIDSEIVNKCRKIYTDVTRSMEEAVLGGQMEKNTSAGHNN